MGLHHLRDYVYHRRGINLRAVATHVQVDRAGVRLCNRVCEIMRGIGSAADRKAIIAVLEEHHVLSKLADAILERRVIPFPVRGPASG